MYLCCNTQVRSCNNFCSGKAIIITQSESVFAGILQAIRMRHIVICILFLSTAFFYIILKTARSSKTVIEHKMRVSIFSTAFV